MINKNLYLPTYRSTLKVLFLICVLVLVYIVENFFFQYNMDNSIYNGVVKPIIWSGVGAVVFSLPVIRPASRIRTRNMLCFWALNFGVVYIIISVLAGLVDGLGRSPYSHEPIGIISNFISVGTALVVKELIRSHIISNFTKEENYLKFIIIALIMTVTGISLKRYTELIGYKAIVLFIAQYFAVDFAHNLFATYLAYIGGPLTSIIYLGTISGFHWFSPILPDLEWITTALIGVMCPVFFLITMQDIYTVIEKRVEKGKCKEESSLSWILTSIVSIGIIWFAVGVFPIYPSVIATGSMEPLIKPGDVVLIRKIVDMEGIRNLKQGDIIQFERNNIKISHRIVEILEDKKTGQISYKTKGDNNSIIDKEMVKPEQMKGIVVRVVPKIGWPTLIIKSKEGIPLDEIIF